MSFRHLHDLRKERKKKIIDTAPRRRCQARTLWLLIKSDASRCGNDRPHRVGGRVQSDETIPPCDRRLRLKLRELMSLREALARDAQCAGLLRNRLDDLLCPLDDYLGTRRQRLPTKKHRLSGALRTAAPESDDVDRQIRPPDLPPVVDLPAQDLS